MLTAGARWAASRSPRVSGAFSYDPLPPCTLSRLNPRRLRRRAPASLGCSSARTARAGHAPGDSIPLCQCRADRALPPCFGTGARGCGAMEHRKQRPWGIKRRPLCVLFAASCISVAIRTNSQLMATTQARPRRWPTTTARARLRIVPFATFRWATAVPASLDIWRVFLSNSTACRWGCHKTPTVTESGRLAPASVNRQATEPGWRWWHRVAKARSVRSLLRVYQARVPVQKTSPATASSSRALQLARQQTIGSGFRPQHRVAEVPPALKLPRV